MVRGGTTQHSRGASGVLESSSDSRLSHSFLIRTISNRKHAVWLVIENGGPRPYCMASPLVTRTRVVQYCRVDSIGKRDLTNRSIRRMVNLYWRSDRLSCRSENCISLAGHRKYFTLILWYSPRLTLSIRSIRSIRRMVNLYWRSDKWSCRSENYI